jgi:hypothetical protein
MTSTAWAILFGVCVFSFPNEEGITQTVAGTTAVVSFVMVAISSIFELA